MDEIEFNNSEDVPRELKTLAWAKDNNEKGELVVEDVDAMAKYLLGLGFEPGIYTLESVVNCNRAFFVLREEDPRCFGLAYDPPYLSKCFNLPYKGTLGT